MKATIVRTLLSAALLLGSVACGDDEPISAAPEPSVSEAETPMPSPDATDDLPAGVNPTAQGILEPGSYQTSSFEPTASFDVGNGWQIAFEGTDYVVLARKLEPKDEVIYLDSSQQALNVGAALRFVQDAFIGTTGVARNFRFFGAGALRIGGFSGRSVSMEVRTKQSVVTLALGIEAYEVRPGDRIDIAAIDVDGETILVFVEAPATRFKAFNKAAKPVLASLSF